MTVEDQAALDDNMPPSEEVPQEEAQEPSPETTATPEEDVSTESQVIEIDEKQKALNKLAFEKREEKRQRIALEEKLASLEAKLPKEQVQVESAPTLEQFDYDEAAFNTANTKFLIEQAKQDIVREQQEQQEQARLAKVQADFNAKASKLITEAPDYQEAIGQIPDLPPETLNAIMQADNGPQLAYYLGKHLDIADSIATLPPMQAAIHLGQISAQLSSVKPETKPSAAPDPISPVDASGSLSKDMNDMSMEDIYNL